jgi:hypothetical protein
MVFYRHIPDKPKEEDHHNIASKHAPNHESLDPCCGCPELDIDICDICLIEQAKRGDLWQEDS